MRSSRVSAGSAGYQLAVRQGGNKGKTNPNMSTEEACDGGAILMAGLMSLANLRGTQEMAQGELGQS